MRKVVKKDKLYLELVGSGTEKKESEEDCSDIVEKVYFSMKDAKNRLCRILVPNFPFQLQITELEEQGMVDNWICLTVFYKNPFSGFQMIPFDVLATPLNQVIYVPIENHDIGYIKHQLPNYEANASLIQSGLLDAVHSICKDNIQRILNELSISIKSRRLLNPKSDG